MQQDHSFGAAGDAAAAEDLGRPAQIDRALGSTENIYHLLDKLYCLNFIVFAQIDGGLDAARIDDALRAVQAEHPLLRARVALVHDRPWFKAVPAEAHPIRVQPAALRHWRRELAAQLDAPFAGGAPLARFLWFGGDGPKTVAAMVFHHAIADGRSGADVFIEVLRRAGGEALPLRCRPARPSAQDLDLIRLQSPLGGAVRKVEFWLKQSRGVLKFARQLPGYDMTAHAARRIEIVSLAVAPTKVRALIAACRANGTTVQGALGAALLLAINREFGSAHARHLGLNSLADLRGILSGGLDQRDLGLYIATINTVHGVPAAPDFWLLARDVADQVRTVLSSGDANLIHTVHSEAVRYPLNEIGARMVQALVGLAPPSSMLTNVGRFDAVALANGARLRSLGFLVSPPAQHPVCVTASSFDGRLHLNLLYDERKVERPQARRIAAAIVESMDEARRGRVGG